jgi:Ca-activated chloride channel family protein
MKGRPGRSNGRYSGRNSVLNYARIVLITSLFFLSAALACPDAVRISQADNSMLLINQRVRLYISVTDEEGKPVGELGEKNFRVFESTEESGEKQRRIVSVKQGVNINEGINLLFVVDNSGSMYWDGSGKVKNSDDPSVWRITYAKSAIGALLMEIKNPLDRVGLVSFNVKMGQKVEPTSDKVETERALQKIRRPAEEEAYTELYETLYWSIDDLRTVRGRKVIIVLSDGVDFPLKENSNFLIRYGMEGAIDLAQKEGISIFSIGLSGRADKSSLKRIAEQTGGAFFSVYDPQRLESLYSLIREQVLNEYLVVYPATMDPATRKRVRVEYVRDGEKGGAERIYFSGTIFGFPWERVNWLFFLLIPGALLLLWTVSLLKFEKKGETASLNVLSVEGGRGGRRGSGGKQTLALGSSRRSVTIGVSSDADITVARSQKVQGAGSEVTIQQKGGVFTLVSRGAPVSVNNRDVKKKVLRSGDLIKVEGTEIVFDRGVKE